MVAPESFENNPFFRSLGPEERALLAAITERRSHKAGETIFEEGKAPMSLRVLETGLVSFRQKQREGGGESAMGTVGEPGDVFGISAVVGEEHLYAHSAVCLEDAVVFEIDGPQLLALCESKPLAGVRILQRLAAVMARRLSAAREQLRSRIRPGLISHG